VDRIAKSERRPGPDFIVIGAMKCATSTVCKYLEDHPDVDMVPGCEPNYFSHDDNYAKGPDWYGRFFADFSGDRIRGEGSNDYVSGAMFPESAARMAADFPDVKLVYMVRHPLRRIISAWTQNRVDTGDVFPPTPDRAVAEMPERYIDRSLYWKNLSRYRAHFDDAQIFIGFMEDLSRDPDRFWADLCGFLGVAPNTAAAAIHANPSQGKRVPTGAYSRLNALSLVRGLKRVLPKRVTGFVKDRFLSREAAAAPWFSPETEARLCQKLRPDAEQLLAHCGKPADFWNLRGSKV